MDGNKCILQLRGVRPFLSDKYDITKHPNFKYTADADDKNAFDIEAFLSARLKLKPNEVCDVYEVALGLARPMSSEARITSRRAMKRGSSPPASMRAR